MREAAHEIRTEVGHLMNDLGRLRERVLNLQKHFGQANEDVAQILISADKVAKRGGRIEIARVRRRRSAARPCDPGATRPQNDRGRVGINLAFTIQVLSLKVFAGARG